MTAGQVIAMLAGMAICAWAVWRIAIAPSVGDWSFKLPVVSIFASCSAWLLDSLSGHRWDWDGPALLASVAVYLVAGMVRHYRSPRAAAEEPTL